MKIHYFKISSSAGDKSKFFSSKQKAELQKQDDEKLFSEDWHLSEIKTIDFKNKKQLIEILNDNF